MPQSNDEPELCTKCGKPVLAGQAVNGATGNHWDCDPVMSPKDTAELFNELHRSLDRVQRGLKRLK